MSTVPVNRVPRSEPSSPVMDYSKDYFVEPMLPRLQRRLSATKKCRTCHKIVYFTGIRCKHCGYIAHETCADAAPHVCTGGELLRRRRCHQTAFPFTPEAISAAAATCSTGSASAPASPKSPKSPISPTEFLKTAFSWMKGTKKSSAPVTASMPASPSTPAKKAVAELTEDRSATWSSPERVLSSVPEQASAIANEDSDNAVSEWCIPAKDLQFEQRLRHGRENDIYEGRWHGAVSIYTFKRSQELWSQVNRLMQVRHENCSLFMGACIERNNLAIVTSPRNGPQVSEAKSQLNVDEKLSVARQVAQGMGYLHAKGIVHGKLNTSNVLLEKRRAKICLLDQSFGEVDKVREGYGCLLKDTVAFWAPELVKKIHINGAKVSVRHPFTRAADVYAFGSFLFELFTGQQPFEGESIEATLYKIGNGLTADFKSHSEIPRPIRDLIVKCWSVVPQDRPTFKHILSFLEENKLACSALHRRHSSSTPNRLDRIGLGLVR
ncbi:kinase suppressor of Ras 1-like isoform X2 [Varroa jacobsoni]|uniref:Kinase suppressor of Ras 2 n=2 Tax=Varroa TaxID=62624 RepID=A0A7M7KQY2_VARDE|nr:kinase suppressor of Ras 1-like [Varroa destructor]XP_022664631.1 kinase suppressor of Ras 1-like [Varroa destructor]XP_022706103.1 kinase suppressor of Ras 1-like isoform X2 [Varroa jacobsoni]XP_022706104.1 kinase suppressor of Ras 1-like isoform X2 [Varroa jacobsoni]XP_022706105.1 kinase suppressor of Ras 1-like isoform X2 [Varroa jacobsoni]